jgi:hypothetical protein
MDEAATGPEDFAEGIAVFGERRWPVLRGR